MELTLVDTHIVTGISSQVRLSDYAIGLFDSLPSKSSVKKAIKEGRVRVDDETASTGLFVRKGMHIQLWENLSRSPKPYKEQIEVVFEDDQLAVVNKPSGLVTMGNQFRTLENMLPFNLNTAPNAIPPKPAHRLDAATSGLVLVAKTRPMLEACNRAFRSREVTKTYHAVVMGPTPEKGEMNDPIEQKPAITTFEKVSRVRSVKNQYLSLMRLYPITGRTHQIRIHCANAGFPIFGDKEYAHQTIRHKGLFLAATELRLKHPGTGRLLHVSIDLPENFKRRMEREERMWNKYAHYHAV